MATRLHRSASLVRLNWCFLSEIIYDAIIFYFWIFKNDFTLRTPSTALAWAVALSISSVEATKPKRITLHCKALI
jgi:hypothetical protein